MKITADEKLNAAYVKLRRGRVVSTIELRPGILFDLDRNGQVLGIEVLALDQLAPELTTQNISRKSA